MTDRVIIRGDDYPNVGNRYVFRFTMVDEALDPMDLTSCTVRSTWRTATVAPGFDDDDTSAPIAARITFDGAGAVTSSSRMALPAGKTAEDGELTMILTRVQTAALGRPTKLIGDVQVLTADNYVHTVMLVHTISTADGTTSDTES